MNNNRTKFIELAEKRVIRTIKDIQLIGNLSNKSNYKYTQEDVSKIIKALENELDTLKARFKHQDSGKDVHFKL